MLLRNKADLRDNYLLRGCVMVWEMHVFPHACKYCFNEKIRFVINNGLAYDVLIINFKNLSANSTKMESY